MVRILEIKISATKIEAINFRIVRSCAVDGVFRVRIESMDVGLSYMQSVCLGKCRIFKRFACI